MFLVGNILHGGNPQVHAYGRLCLPLLDQIGTFWAGIFHSSLPLAAVGSLLRGQLPGP